MQGTTILLFAASSLLLVGCPNSSLFDFDGDGSIDSEDCDPENPDVYPGAPDSVGDGVDSNCDGEDGVRNCDQDGDDFLDVECSGGNDCDDTDPAIHPGAVELCDGEDGNCDGSLPAEEQDGDGDGDPGCSDCDDTDPELSGGDEDQDGYDECMGDCEEGNASVYPGANDEWGDGIDQNCDGVDGDDQDGDGSPGNATPPGLSTPEWDCDDFDPARNRADLDADGTDTCAEPPDCDDLDANRYPGNAEDACDGLDTDCIYDANEVDDDGDGWAECAGDCDDADPAMLPVDGDGDGWTLCDDCDDGDPGIFPTNPEVCDGIDVDCVFDPEEVDDDGDGWRECEGDCSDASAALHPYDSDGDGVDDACGWRDVAVGILHTCAIDSDGGLISPLCTMIRFRSFPRSMESASCRSSSSGSGGNNAASGCTR